MSHAPLFDFVFTPIEQVTPWGEPPHLSLGWYALTDGCYWIRVGENELFRYSDFFLNHFKFQGPYDRYFVGRLDADLGQLAFHALEPVPQEIAEFIPQVDQWRRRRNSPPIPAEVIRGLDAANGVSTNVGDEEFDIATDWWRARQMQVMHLKYNPIINIWTTDDIAHIAWENRQHSIDGHPVWTAEAGCIEIPLEGFMAEIRDFRNRFITGMRERVDRVRQSWSRPEIAIDLSQLQNAQETEEISLPKTCSQTAQADWAPILAILRRQFPR